MTIRLALVSLATSVLVIGCAGPVGSQEDARAGWTRTNSVLESGNSAAQAGGATAPTEDPVFRAGTPVSVNFEYGCPGAGTISYIGNYYIDTVGATNVEFNYEAEFKKCTDGNGLTIDGTIDYAMSVETSDTGSSVVYSYDGELTWDGDVQGSCEISMSASVTTTTTSASVSYSGSICGYDAAATLNVG